MELIPPGGPNRATERLAVTGEALAASATLALAVAAVVRSRPGQLPLAAVVAVALAWSTTPLLAELLARAATARRAAATGPGDPPAPSGRRDGSVTTFIRLGDEPEDVALATVRMAAAGGPVALVADERRAVSEPIISTGVPIFTAATIEEAITAAVHEVTTDAVLLVSARSVPRVEACREAASLLGSDLGWVTGYVQPFSPQGFAPVGRWTIGAKLRARARGAGVELWEPDATVVRSDVLRDHPMTAGRPWGSWLRSLAGNGLGGMSTDRMLALRMTPLDADAFWPDTVARQRAAAADLSRAITSGRPVTRALAVLLLLRELYGLPMLGWLALPALLGTKGTFPFDTPASWSALLAVALLGTRWLTLRAALDVPRRPGDDLVSALHHLPGSLAATTTAVTRRVRPLRTPVPTRPLVWAALLLTVAAGATLVDREPGVPVSKLSVGTSLVTLAVLWAFNIASLVRRRWQRSTHRVPVDLPAVLERARCRTVDCSPTGISVIGGLPQGSLAVGQEVELQVELDDGVPMDCRAVVASLRRHGGRQLVGLALSLDDEQQAPWLGQVLRAADSSTGPAASPVGARGVKVAVERPTDLWGRIGLALDRVVAALVAIASLALVAVLAAVMLGFEPLVVRSASMEPTLGIGDVILSEHVLSTDLEPGDIVTQPDGIAVHEAMTHRVRSIHRGGDGLVIVTQGDANDSGETWTVAPDALVGRVRWSVPWVGRFATGVRTSSVQLLVGGLVLVAVAGAIVRPRRRPAPAAPVGG